MMSLKLIELDRTIRNLSLAEKQWLLDRLTQQVQNKNPRSSQFADMSSIERQLQEMPNDSDIQREVATDRRKFEIAELDTLEDL